MMSGGSGMTNVISASTMPMKNSHTLSAFNRGNATSFAPIMSGMK
jgi:hypothetical protein